jgi:hypothetical protein
MLGFLDSAIDAPSDSQHSLSLIGSKKEISAAVVVSHNKMIRRQDK